MPPLVTIITPTAHRPEMFAECATAVLAQRFSDWTWWVVFNWETGEQLPPYDWRLFNYNRVVPLMFPIKPGSRSRAHIPATIINWLYPKVTTPYIYFLADDDLIDRDGLGALVKAAISYEDSDGCPIGADAVYGRCEVLDQQPDGTYKHGAWCYDAGDVGGDTGINPNCRLDGGQVLHTADLWRRATADGWTLSDKPADAGACDGLLLARLAKFARFHYVPQRIVTHRRHAGATCHKPQLS